MSTVRLPDGTEFEAEDPLDAVDMALAYRAGEIERELAENNDTNAIADLLDQRFARLEEVIRTPESMQLTETEEFTTDE